MRLTPGQRTALETALREEMGYAPESAALIANDRERGLCFTAGAAYGMECAAKMVETWPAGYPTVLRKIAAAIRKTVKESK